MSRKILGLSKRNWKCFVVGIVIGWATVLWALACRAGVPVEFTVETSRADVHEQPCYHGETLDFDVTFKSYGKNLMLPTNAQANIFWQTNGMSAFFWRTNNVTVVSNKMYSTFTPAMDPGTGSCFGFLGIPGVNYRASFVLRFKNSPGAEPKIMEWPYRELDFDKIEMLHEKWYRKEASDAMMVEVLQMASNRVENQLSKVPGMVVANMTNNEISVIGKGSYNLNDYKGFAVGVNVQNISSTWSSVIGSDSQNVSSHMTMLIGNGANSENAAWSLGIGKVNVNSYGATVIGGLASATPDNGDYTITFGVEDSDEERVYFGDRNLRQIIMENDAGGLDDGDGHMLWADGTIGTYEIKIGEGWGVWRVKSGLILDGLGWEPIERKWKGEKYEIRSNGTNLVIKEIGIETQTNIVNGFEARNQRVRLGNSILQVSYEPMKVYEQTNILKEEDIPEWAKEENPPETMPYNGLILTNGVTKTKGGVEITATNVGAYPNASGQILSAQVATQGAHLNAEDAQCIVTNYDSVTHLREMKLRIKLQEGGTNVWREIWDEMDRWNAFTGTNFNWQSWIGIGAWIRNIEAALDLTSPKEYAFYDGVTGDVAPDGFFWISQPRIGICAGAGYQRYLDAGAAVWILESNGMCANVGGTTNGYFRISDEEGNVHFEIVKGDKETVPAISRSVTCTNVMGVTHWHSVYAVTNAISPPVAKFCRDLATQTWVADTEASCPCNVVWTPGVNTYTLEFWPKANEPKMFCKAEYDKGGETKIRQTVPTEMQYIILNGTKYGLVPKTVNGEVVMGLTTGGQ